MATEEKDLFRIYQSGEKFYKIDLSQVDSFTKSKPDAREVSGFSVGDKSYDAKKIAQIGKVSDFVAQKKGAKPIYVENNVEKKSPSTALSSKNVSQTKVPQATQKVITPAPTPTLPKLDSQIVNFYEDAEGALVSKKKRLNQFDQNISDVIRGGPDDLGNKFKPRVEKNFGAAERLIYERDVTAAQARADQARNKYQESIESFVAEEIKSKGANPFLKTNSSGDKVPSEGAISQWANGIMERSGGKINGYAHQYLKKMMYNTVASYDIAEQAKKDADKFIASKYGKTLDQIKSSSEFLVTGTGRTAKDLLSEAGKISSSAKKTSQQLSLQLGEEGRIESQQMMAPISESFKALGQENVALNSQYQKDIENLSLAVQSGVMDRDAALASQKQIQSNYNQKMAEITARFELLNAQSLSVQSAINNKYKARFEREIDEVKRASETRIDKINKELEKLNVDPKIIDEYKKAFSSAFDRISNQKQAKLLANERARVYGKSVFIKAINPAIGAAADWVAAIPNFFESFVNGLGGDIQRMSSLFQFEAGEVFGGELANSYTKPQFNLESWKDLADPVLATGSGGQTIGGMMPMITVQSLTAMATGGRSIPAQMALQSSIGFAMETMSIAGGVYDDVFTKTGDVSKANEAASITIGDQIRTMYMYALDGIPFINKITFGIKGRGIGKTFARATVKAGTETATEIPQEFIQGGSEERAVETITSQDGQEVPLSKFIDIFNNKAYLDSNGTVTTPLDRLKSTAINVIPGTVLMGGSGEFSQYGSNKFREGMGRIAAMKSAIGEISPSFHNQYVFDILLNKGEAFASGYVRQLAASGVMTSAQYSNLISNFETLQTVRDLYQSKKITQDQARVMTALAVSVNAEKAALDSATNQIEKDVAQERYNAAKSKYDSYIKTGKGSFVIIDLPNNERYIASYEEYENMLSNEDFVNSASDNISINIIGDGMTTSGTNLSDLSKLKLSLNEAGEYDPNVETGREVGNIFARTEIPYANQQIEDLEARMDNAEEIPMSEINIALENLYKQLENIYNNFFDSQSGKQAAQIINDTIDKFQTYEFATEKEVKVLTETATVQTARAAVEKEVGAEVGIIQGARGPKATAQITSSDGTSGTYSIEIDGDGNVTFEQKGAAPIPVGTRKDVDKSARLVDAQFDEKGMPTSITFTVSSADGKDYTINVTPQNKLKPEKLLDLAISIRANEIGTVDPTAFDEAVRVVSQETVETTTFPNIRTTEAAPAAPAAEVTTTPTAEAEPAEPMLEKAEVKKAIDNLQKGLRAAGISVQLVEDPAEWNKIISQKGGSEKTEGIFVSAEGKIYLDRNKLSQQWGRTIIFHEGTHPIINIIRNTNPKLYNSVVRALRAEAKKNKGIADVERWSNEQPEFRREDEFITETFARIADGKIIMSQLSTGLRRLIMDYINKIGAMLGNKKAIAYTDYKNAVQLAKRITNVVKRGQGIETVVGAENVSQFKFIAQEETPGSLIGSGNIIQSRIAESKKTSEPSIDLYGKKDISELPQRSLQDVYDQYNGKAVFINSDPTNVGDLVLPSGKKIFMYGGPGYLSIADNVNSGVGFASTQISKVGVLTGGNIGGWAKLVNQTFGEDVGVTMIVSQSPASVLGNSYALRYVMDAISILPKSVRKKADFKSEFFGKDIQILKVAFGEKNYNDFVKKYKKIDLSSNDAIEEMIRDMAYKMSGLAGEGKSFKARRAFVENMLAGIRPKKELAGMKDEAGMISIKPIKRKFIASALFNELGINAEKVIRDIGQKNIVDQFIDNGSWGFAVSGFETKPNITVEDIESIQGGGVTHPLFNAKFPGSNSFILDGLYQIDEIIKPIILPDGYKKTASQMLSGSIYVGGEMQGMPTAVGKQEVAFQTSAGGRVSPQEFSNNVSAEVERIKAATEETGVTLNLDGTTYTEGGLVVPAGSLNVPQGEVSVDGLLNFIEQNRDKISSDIFKVGLYRFKDRPEVSYDLNIVIPNEYRDIAIEFGRLAGQESLFDLDTFENIKTGSDGKNPIDFSAEQLASIAQDLSAGMMPSVVQPSAGGRGPLSSVEETTRALEGKNISKIEEEYALSLADELRDDLFASYEDYLNAFKSISNERGFSTNTISEAYHMAKQQGTSPDFVKAVEDILTTPGYQASAGGRDLVAGTYYEPNLTTDENGNYVFFHVTDANPKSILKGIDSRKFQSLRTSREEKGLQYGIASFYTKPTDGERVVGGDKYYVTIRPEDVYPMDTDPNGYRAAAEKKVKPGTPFREEKVKKAIADAATKDGYQMAVGEWTYDRAGRRVSEIPSLRGDALVKLIPKPYTGEEAFTTGEERGITTQYPGQEYFAAKEDLSNIASEIASARSKKNKFDEVYTIADTISTYNGVVENYGEPNERIRDINQEEFDTLYSGATPTQKKALDAIADVYMAGAPQFSEGGRNPNITRPVVGKINWERSPEGKGDPAISSRNAIVQQASNDLKEGVITNEEYRATVSQNSPINPITRFFEPATLKEIIKAFQISTKKETEAENIGKPIQDGTEVGLRLDIPSYKYANTWVVSIHNGYTAAGKILSYANVAKIKNVRFDMSPLAALNIATGRKTKESVARMYGEWENIPGETMEEQGENAKQMVQDIVDDPAYVQVGMNPFRHSYFYDRNTDIGRPVISADEVIQVGGLVYAKNPVYGNWTDEAFRVKGLFDKAGFPVQFSAGGRGAAAPITQATGGPMPTNVRRRGGISAASLRRVMPGQEAMDLRESILADNRSYYTPNNWAKISSKVDQLTELELIDYMDASDPQKIYDKIVVMGGPSAPIAFVKYYQLMRDKAQRARAIGNIAEAEQIEADIKDRFLDVKSIGTVAAQTLSMFRILKSTRNDAEFHTDIIEAVIDSAGGMLSKEQRDRVLKMVQDVLSTNNFYEGTADQVYADPTSATDQDLADLAIAKMWKADAVSKLNIYISILLQDRASEIYGGSVKGHLLGVSSMIISGTSNILNIPNRASELAVQRQIVRAGRMLKILTPETKTAYGKPLGSRIKGMRDAMVRLINEMKLMAKNPFKYIYNKIKSIREEIKDRPGGQTILSGAADIVVYGNRDLNDKLYGVNGQLNPWISLMRVLGKNKKPVGDFRGMIEDVKQSFKKKDFVNWLSESKGMTYDEYKNLGNKNKVDLREEFFADKLSVQPVTRSVVKDIAKASAAAAEFNFRAIALTDYVPRNIQEQIMLDRIAETLGLDGVDKALFKHDPYKYVENRNDLVSKEVLDYWYKYAAELTLTKDTFMGSASVAAANLVKFGTRRLIRKANLQDSIIGNTVETIASLAVDTLMPFVRLPMNATSYALDYAIPAKSWTKAGYYFISASQAKKDGNIGLASSYELSATKYVARGMVGMAYMYLVMQLITIPGLLTLGSGEDDDDEERRISKDMPRNRLNISAFNRYILGLAGQGDGDTRFRPGEDKTIDLIPMGVLGLMIYAYGNQYKKSRTKYLDQKYDPELLNRPIGENKTLRDAEWAGNESPDMFSAMMMQDNVIGYYFDQAWFLGITNWVKAFTAKGDDAEYMWNKAMTDLVGTAISSSVLFSNYAKKTSDVMIQMSGKPLPDINMAKVDDYDVPIYNRKYYKALASRNGLVDFISGIDPYQDRYISFAMFGEYARPLKGATRSLPGTIWALNTPTREVVGDWSDMQRYYVYIYGQRNQIKLNGNYSMDLREPYLGTVESTMIPAEGIEGGGYAGKFQVPPKDYNELNHASGRIRERLYNTLSEQWMNTTIGGVKITPEDLENPKLSNRKQIMDAKRGMAVAISEANRITKEFLRPWSLFKDEEGMTRFIGLGTVEKIQKIQAMVDSYIITYQVYDPKTNTVKDSYDYLSDPEIRTDLVDLAYRSIEMYVRELEKSKENFQEIQRIQKEEDANAEDLMNYINNLEQ